MDDLEQQVKKANKDFFDTVGASYEEVDGRRSTSLLNYAQNQLRSISNGERANSLLDLGCGSGFISKASTDLFDRRFALDISFEIVKAIQSKSTHKLVADTDFIPCRGSSIDCVVSFAVLHHCFSYEKLFSEIFRVLKKGGVFYSDHDMDANFYNQFKPLMILYRKLKQHGNPYLNRYKELSQEQYDLSEIHQNGIPSRDIDTMLRDVGFKDVRMEYHWYGLTGWADKIFGPRSFAKGYAPLVRIIATK